MIEEYLLNTLRIVTCATQNGFFAFPLKINANFQNLILFKSFSSAKILYNFIYNFFYAFVLNWLLALRKCMNATKSARWLLRSRELPAHLFSGTREWKIARISSATFVPRIIHTRRDEENRREWMGTKDVFPGTSPIN